LVGWSIYNSRRCHNMSVNIVLPSSNSVSVTTSTPNTVAVSNSADGGDLHFEYTQSVASDQWDITHNLNKKPAVSVLDSNDYVVFAVVHHITNNRVIIEFKAPTFGKAVFN